MMFLQYWVWGAWQPVIATHFQGKLGFTGVETAWIFALLPIACMLIPPLGGQLADRWISTEKLLAGLHLAGAIFLCLTATAESFNSMLVLMGGWSLVYAPTLALTNSLAFHHMPDAENKFGLVRVWGTIGWIAASFSLTGIRKLWPDGLPVLSGADSLWLGAAGSFILAVYCLALPHTPPAQSGERPWAFLEALRLLKDPFFLVFIIVVFVVSTELQFYYIFTSPFLESLGIHSSNVPAIMSIAQIAEIGMMLALPWMLSKWGVRRALAIGILAWPLRYAVFAYGGPKWLVIAALSLHGLCFVCFLVVAFIYVNSVAPRDIKASAQALITFVSLGLGLAVGSLFAGWIRDYFTTGPAIAPVVDYSKVFLVPCVLTIVCAVLFFIGFREPKRLQEEPA